MPVITSIETQKKRSRRRSIFLDNEYFFGVDEQVVADLKLQEGQTIDPVKIRKIIQIEELKRAKDYAFKVLSYRSRSEKEIYYKLKSRGFDEAVIAEAISFLKEYDFIDDEKFAFDWAKSRMTSKCIARDILKKELLLKKISADTILKVLDEVYNGIDEVQLACHAMTKKIKSYEKLDMVKRIKRSQSYLLRRGFSYEVIKKALNKLEIV